MRFSTLTPIASAVLASVLMAGCAGTGSPAGGTFAPTVSGAARSFGHARPLPGTEILRHAVASLHGYVEPHADRSIAVASGRSRQTGAQVYVSDIGTNLVLGFAQRREILVQSRPIGRTHRTVPAAATPWMLSGPPDPMQLNRNQVTPCNSGAASSPTCASTGCTTSAGRTCRCRTCRRRRRGRGGARASATGPRASEHQICCC